MNSVIPAPIARQPWGMLAPLFILVAFGAAVLFSAAGGNFQPFAMSHLIRFSVFLVMASIMVLFSRDAAKFMAYPVYGMVLILLIAVEAIGAMGVVKIGSNNLQVIIGTEAEEIAHAMKQIPESQDLTSVQLPS